MLSKPETILLAKLEEEIDSRAFILAQGGAKDYPEYRQAAGIIEGLRIAIDLLHQTNKEITGGEK